MLPHPLVPTWRPPPPHCHPPAPHPPGTTAMPVPTLASTSARPVGAATTADEALTAAAAWAAAAAQVRYAFHAVGPDEYDAAARAADALRRCPLLAAGDLRCGRRLIADAEADAAETAAAAAWSVRGCALLDNLAAQLELGLPHYAATAAAATAAAAAAAAAASVIAASAACPPTSWRL
jgi:hypothetical protein